MQVKKQKQQLEPDMEQQIGSKLEKEYDKAIYCYPAYLTSVQSTSCEILGCMNHKVESRLLGEMMIPLVMLESQEELKLLDDGKRGE